MELVPRQEDSFTSPSPTLSSTPSPSLSLVQIQTPSSSSSSDPDPSASADFTQQKTGTALPSSTVCGDATDITSPPPPSRGAQAEFTIPVFIGSVTGSFVLGTLVGITLLHLWYQKKRPRRDQSSKEEKITCNGPKKERESCAPELPTQVQRERNSQRGSVAQTRRSTVSRARSISHTILSDAPPSESSSNLLPGQPRSTSTTFLSLDSLASSISNDTADTVASAHTSFSNSTSDYSGSLPPYTYEELFTIPENFYYPPGLVSTGESPYYGMIQRSPTRISSISEEGRHPEEAMADDSPTLPPGRNIELLSSPDGEDFAPDPPHLAI